MKRAVSAKAVSAPGEPEGCGVSRDFGNFLLRRVRGTSTPIGRITSFSAKFTDAPLAEGKFEIYLHEREDAKKPRAVRLSRPQLPMINCSAARRA